MPRRTKAITGDHLPLRHDLMAPDKLSFLFVFENHGPLLPSVSTQKQKFLGCSTAKETYIVDSVIFVTYSANKRLIIIIFR